jgi:hypothetical protein
MISKTTAGRLMIALFIISISVASASETGLFSEMIETEYTDDRLEAIDNAAETVSISQTTGQTTVEISQAYYEGNRIYISYHVNGVAEILDGLELEDGSFADITAGGEVQQDDGTVIGWRECIVPEDELAETQTFCLAYRIPESEEKQLLKFTLKQHPYNQYLQGISLAETFQARAILYTGKVDLKGIVVMTSPEQAASWIAWQEGEEETGTDVIVCWNLYQNDVLVSTDLCGESAINGTEEVTFAVMFPFMDNLSNLTLVPEYSEGGEKPEEAIVLELMNQQEEESPLVSLANPWTELPTKQQLEDVTGVSFSIPEDAENIRYRCLQDEGLAEVQFSRDGDEYCVRAVNQTEGSPDDISGLYYEWMDEETFSFGNCSGIFGRARDGSRWVERCLWVDPNHEVNWSLAVFTADPGSLDIVGIAEKICLSDNAGISD